MSKDNKFNRAEYMREKHKVAREQRTLFSSKFENEKPKYFEFMKAQTPLTEKVVSYEVSYQVSYQSTTESFTSTPATFQVYGLRGKESDIEERALNMILDSKGKISNHNFSGGTISMLENNLEIKAKPRGIEKSETQISPSDARKVFENEYHVKELDKLTFTNKKGRTGNMDLDINHFL